MFIIAKYSSIVCNKELSEIEWVCTIVWVSDLRQIQARVGLQPTPPAWIHNTNTNTHSASCLLQRGRLQTEASASLIKKLGWRRRKLSLQSKPN